MVDNKLILIEAPCVVVPCERGEEVVSVVRVLPAIVVEEFL